MIALTLPGKGVPVIGGLVGGSSIPTITQPPPPPKRDDPAVAAAQKEVLQAEKRRKGRAATLIADQDALGTPTVSRPTARAAVNFGG